MKPTVVLLTARAEPPAALKAKVARVWRGKMPKAKADECAKYLYEAGVTKLCGIKGKLDVQTYRRDRNDVTEFVVIPYWPDWAVIKAYAGDDIEKTRHLPKDKDYLIDPEDTVAHYDMTTNEWAK